ncbi:MAG TPA: hypothetical protein PKA30_01210 [Accumulibacter sp.]|uniref:hypothetical protein n=1 Tax=Accumulibacter sp. TaxID=2053492 RepID=UPI00287992CB|nr:hypothetical protein [Accumulibacter sp.]MDS4013082.1 hypothetical protein [Accumulibacter sp.]MDS4055466.1 hypothetical protein [Accumulibacter sp.]HMV04144.1 hypothetical protein [Accumulibacter sp.]HMW63629.1 hypothetical protein [Accumulibacter sp.]HMW79943.1 hypothetical protein [Accumulibacter sp.]
MTALWSVLALCIVFVLGAAIPLLRDRRADHTPLPGRPETLRDWRRPASDQPDEPSA